MFALNLWDFHPTWDKCQTQVLQLYLPQLHQAAHLFLQAPVDGGSYSKE